MPAVSQTEVWSHHECSPSPAEVYIYKYSLAITTVERYIDCIFVEVNMDCEGVENACMYYISGLTLSKSLK